MNDKIYVLMETTADSPTEPGITNALMAFDNRADADAMLQSSREFIDNIRRKSGIYQSLSYYVTETQLAHHQSHQQL